MRLMVYGDVGGSEGYVRYCKFLFGNKLIPDDVEVWFVCSSSFRKRLGTLDPGVHIISHSWIASLKRLYRLLWYYWIFPGYIRKIKPDVEFYAAGHLRVHFRKAITLTACHNLLYFDEQEFKRIENKPEKRDFYRYRRHHIHSLEKSNGVILLSEYSREVISKAVPGIKNSAVIAHGLDPVFLFPEKRSYELGEQINILYVSPVYDYKHHKEVVKAVKILRESLCLDIRLDLPGGGDQTTFMQLKQFIQDEDAVDFVNLAGNVEYSALPEYYKAADIFIFASSCETFGITLLEAMGARLPIACSNRTGLADILRDAGVYFDPENSRDIANAVQKLITDITLRKTSGEKAYLYASDYTWERCAAETFGYIKNLKRQSHAHYYL